MRAGCHSGADLFQMSLHGGGVAPGHDEAGALALCRADGAEDVGRNRALVVRRPRTRAASGPSPGQFVLLPDTGLVLEPDLDLDACTDPLLDCRQFGGEVFLNASTASAFWA